MSDQNNKTKKEELDRMCNKKEWIVERCAGMANIGE